MIPRVGSVCDERIAGLRKELAKAAEDVGAVVLCQMLDGLCELRRSFG